jgi:surface protein
MFNSCLSLTSVPLFNTSAVTNMSGMFGYCSALTSIPLFDTSAVTNMGSMFVSCISLASVPSFNASAATNMAGMFSNCINLKSINLLQTGAGSTGKFNTIFSGCINLSRGILRLAKLSISYSSCNLSRLAIQEIFTELDTTTIESQVITITNNPGAPTPIITTTSSAVTAGATIIPVASTANLAIGMQVTGTGTPLTTGRAVTFTDAGDIVTLTAHGLQNNDQVSFSTITSTTGIVLNTIYFVVNRTADTFQVSSTLGGAALPLTTNGSGTLKFNPTIQSIGAGNVTISRPTGAISSGVSLSFRQLSTAIAIFKNFSVTG